MYDIEIEKACGLKWAAGVEEHRITGADDGFVGAPDAEAYAELIDLINYLRVAREQGRDRGWLLEPIVQLTRAYRETLLFEKGEAPSPNTTRSTNSTDRGACTPSAARLTSS